MLTKRAYLNRSVPLVGDLEFPLFTSFIQLDGFLLADDRSGKFVSLGAIRDGWEEVGRRDGEEGAVQGVLDCGEKHVDLSSKLDTVWKSDYDVRLPSSEHIGSCTVTKNVLFELRRASVRSEFEKGNQDPLYGPVLMIRRTISQPAI